VHWQSGRRWLNVDTRTWRVTPDTGGSFPWLWLGIGLGLAAALLLLLRRIVLPKGTLSARPA
jgi:LPXTG-motif cell wall-anchored protein